MFPKTRHVGLQIPPQNISSQGNAVSFLMACVFYCTLYKNRYRNAESRKEKQDINASSIFLKKKFVLLKDGTWKKKFDHKQTCCYPTIVTVFTQCPNSGVEPRRWVSSFLGGGGGVGHWPVFTQWSHSRSRPRNWGRTNELKYKISLATHGKVPYIAGADPASVYTQQKRGVTASGVESCSFEGAQKAGQTPQSFGAGEFRLHWGTKGGVWPRIWGSTP